MLTAEEIDAVRGTRAAVGCPVLVTLSGSSVASSCDQLILLDEVVQAALNAHQRNDNRAGGPPGPDS